VDGGSVKGEVGFRLVHQPGQALYVPEIERNVAEPRRGSHVSTVGIPANAGDLVASPKQGLRKIASVLAVYA